MAITRKYVENVATLSRLALSEEEIIMHTDQMGKILAYVEKLNLLDTENVEPTTSSAASSVALRIDVVMPSLSHDDALRNAPEKEKGCFKVPKIIE